jgi:HipA-like C-terminal domain
MNPSKISLPEQVASLLARGEPMTAAQLCAATGKSQPSISLALQALGDQVCKMGAARSTRYALRKDILGLAHKQPIYWETPSGDADLKGMLDFLHGQRVCVKWVHGSEFLSAPNALPWFLTPLRPQGFLGRQLARVRSDFPADPDDWTIEQVLYIAVDHIRESIGAVSVGEQTGRLVEEVSQELAARLRQYDERALSVGQTLPSGSSAGGEQPKFTAELPNLPDWQHLVVKFSPPHGTPFGTRWGVMLLLEALALDVLQSCGIAVAKATAFRSEKRTYLESVRFDRVGIEGKHHVVAIAALHDEFTPGTKQHWVHTAQGLHAKKLITKDELHTIATIHAFGHYIGNTDMHFGNLSFFVDDVIKPKIRLAPVYDMLPMMWRPDPYTGLTDSPVRPQPMPAGFAAEQVQAREWAIEFWEQAAQLDIGADLQAASLESARRLKINFANL